MPRSGWLRAVPGPSAPRRPIVWLMLSNRVGDNNQLTALAEELGYSFEVKDLAFNQLRHFRPLHGSGLAIVTKESRRLIEPPWPDLVISAGYPSVPVARYIRQRSGGRTKTVHIGNARTDIEDFDLHLTTPQYPQRPRKNLIELPFPIGNPANAAQPAPEELRWLRALRRPLRLIAVGGPARHWQLDHAALGRAIRILRAQEQTGSIIVATSPRTDRRSHDFLKRSVRGANEIVVEDFPRFAVLLEKADEIHVTADSVSMISEAILTGRAVGVIPIKRSLRGLLTEWLFERPLGRRSLPDFPNFWDLLGQRRLVGTVELPVASQVCDTVERAAHAVRSLLAPGDAVDDGKAECAAAHLGTAGSSRGR